MKRFKNLVVGGIQAKVICLILFTVLLLSGAYLVVSLSQSTLMSRVASESSRRQRESIGEITGETLNGIVKRELERFNRIGEYCIECAMPVYGRDGTLQAAVGADLFIDQLDRAPSSCFKTSAKPWTDL